MEVSPSRRGRASRPFVTTPHDGSSGEVTAILPAQGPCWSQGSPCHIARHHRRARKTGPRWGWVEVVHCTVHGRAFTAYPPGYAPYGRVPLVALAPDGGVLESEADGESPTLFTAAHEAASGFRWPRDDGEAGVRSTQRRHVARGLQILGVSGARPGPALAAAVTALPEGQLVEVATRLSSTEKIVEKGLELDRLVVDLAREARTGQARMDRLAVLGHLVGLWGPVYRWLPRPGRLLALGPAGTVPREAASREPSAVHDFGPRPPP